MKSRNDILLFKTTHTQKGGAFCLPSPPFDHHLLLLLLLLLYLPPFFLSFPSLSSLISSFSSICFLSFPLSSTDHKTSSFITSSLSTIHSCCFLFAALLLVEFMEKPSRTKGGSGFLSFLPKSTAFSFSSRPFSPGWDKHRSHMGKGFSGPLISVVPMEARRTTRNGSFYDQEPTSPKVSCIGQIKHKKKVCKEKCDKAEKVKKKDKGSSVVERLFRGGQREKKKSSVGGVSEEVLNGPTNIRAPALGQMKRFSSGREAFSDFDWQGGAAALGRHRGYYSDEERGESDDEDDEFFVPHSAPLGGGVGRMMAL